MLKNVYICSTLKHLLFSVSKASNEPHTPAAILFFYDYQNVDMDALDITQLPAHIQVIMVNRQALSKALKKTVIGKMLLFFALRKLSLPVSLKQSLCAKLNHELLNLNIILGDVKLFVFNELNKMSRLFRLLVDDYDMIEDGTGNYYRIPVKRSDKVFLRYIMGKPSRYWVFGEEKQCKVIHVIYPENLPEDVRLKGKKIDFLGLGVNLQILNALFKFHDNVRDLNVIIATQPFSDHHRSQFHDANFPTTIYQKIIDYCDRNNMSFAFKIHPRESEQDYQQHFSDAIYLPAKLPLELIVMNCQTKPIIISISSTAGLGFEALCHRRPLVSDRELGEFVEFMMRWENNTELLKGKIQEQLR